MLTLLVGIVLLIAILSWFNFLRAKEQALLAGLAHCKAKNWQLLDDTVALKKLRLMRDSGRLVLVRHYQFDYCAENEARKVGRIVLIGKRVLGISSVDNSPTTQNKILSFKDYRHKKPANEG